MKLGVLQFFSWPGRHGPLEEVYARALERIEIMDTHRLRRGVAGRAPLHDLQRLPVGAHDGHAGGGAHQAAAHRHGGVAGGALSSAAARRGGGAARRAVGRPGQLGRRPWLRPFGVRGLRRADRGKRRRFREAVEIVLQALEPRSASATTARISRSTTSRCCPSRCSSRLPVWMAATSEGAIDWAAAAASRS